MVWLRQIRLYTRIYLTSNKKKISESFDSCCESFGTRQLRVTTRVDEYVYDKHNARYVPRNTYFILFFLYIFYRIPPQTCAWRFEILSGGHIGFTMTWLFFSVSYSKILPEVIIRSLQSYFILVQFVRDIANFIRWSGVPLSRRGNFSILSKASKNI